MSEKLEEWTKERSGRSEEYDNKGAKTPIPKRGVELMKRFLFAIMLSGIFISTACAGGLSKKAGDSAKNSLEFLDSRDDLIRARNDTLAEMYLLEKELEKLQRRLEEIMTRIRVRQDAERRIDIERTDKE